MDINNFNKVDLYKLVIMASQSILEDIELMTADNVKNIEINIKDKEDLIHEIMSKIARKNAEIYDTDPVSYCTACLSLKIKRLEVLICVVKLLSCSKLLFFSD